MTPSAPAPAPPPAIVLVRPQLGENIGKAARAMLNFALTDLRLVAPRDGWPNPAAGPAASGADVVLERARVFDTVAEAVADGRLEALEGPTPGQRAYWLVAPLPQWRQKKVKALVAFLTA